MDGVRPEGTSPPAGKTPRMTSRTPRCHIASGQACFQPLCCTNDGSTNNRKRYALWPERMPCPRNRSPAHPFPLPSSCLLLPASRLQALRHLRQTHYRELSGGRPALILLTCLFPQISTGLQLMWKAHRGRLPCPRRQTLLFRGVFFPHSPNMHYLRQSTEAVLSHSWQALLQGTR